MKLLLQFTLFLGAMAAHSATALDARDVAVHKELGNLVTMISDGPATLVDKTVVIQYTALPSITGAISNAVVLFNIESFGGGNGSHQFLAIFSQGSKDGLNPDWPFREWRLLGFTRVGKDWERWFSKMQVQGDRISLSGVSWIDRDAHCCPSGKAQAVFQFCPYSIVEVPMAANQPLHPDALTRAGERRR